MSQEKIIARMKKLLAMSEDGANEHEAMLATKRLHSLLAKHNISMSELSTEENPVGEGGFESRSRPWRRLVAAKIAELYFCSFYYQQSARSNCVHYMFIGSEANRAFAIHISNLIFKAIEYDARVESKRMYGKEEGSFVNSFWTGAKQRIIERCDDLIDSAKEGTLEDENGINLPALLPVYEQNQIRIDDWKSINLPDLRKKMTTTSINNRYGLAKGRQAGNRVQLSRSLQGKQQKLLGN